MSNQIFTNIGGREKKTSFFRPPQHLADLGGSRSHSSMCGIVAVKKLPWGRQTCSPRSVRGSMRSSPEFLSFHARGIRNGPVKTGRNIICRWVPGKVHPLEMIITDPFEKNV